MTVPLKDTHCVRPLKIMIRIVLSATSEMQKNAKNANKCKKIQKNAKKCKKMQKMQKNAKKCKEMQKNAKKCKKVSIVTPVLGGITLMRVKCLCVVVRNSN